MTFLQIWKSTWPTAPCPLLDVDPTLSNAAWPRRIAILTEPCQTSREDRRRHGVQAQLQGEDARRVKAAQHLPPGGPARADGPERHQPLRAGDAIGDGERGGGREAPAGMGSFISRVCLIYVIWKSDFGRISSNLNGFAAEFWINVSKLVSNPILNPPNLTNESSTEHLLHGRAAPLLLAHQHAAYKHTGPGGVHALKMQHFNPIFT